MARVSNEVLAEKIDGLARTLEAVVERQDKQLVKHDEAIFGDGNGKPGLAAKVHELQASYQSILWGLRLIGGLLAAGMIGLWFK